MAGSPKKSKRERIRSEWGSNREQKFRNGVAEDRRRKPRPGERPNAKRERSGFPQERDGKNLVEREKSRPKRSPNAFYGKNANFDLKGF